MKNQIKSVRIETVADDNPDTSYLGNYSNSPKNPYSIDRQERGDMRGNEYRYFNPVASNWGGDTEENKRKYAEQDYQRMEALNAGQWNYVGVIAKAVVISAQGITQTLRSGGLWGIESDSDKDYLKQVADDELAGLRSELEAFGFGKRAIDYAFRNVEN